ncbi:LysM peptidoglycan-binding domain-containing protein [Paracoccus caeni]|uniref:LysM peptidoglycan-binding domain-containing protein n=1 Tax=Paracoccus caeni TaxID=657651 RepID=A0A934SE73_9RHOB|nr:LysM peptidoglycan-binding domain-containing protein [Paracoccus caeni]MBK4215739.1 LysM peptidoglycan-binding domain-containing protein [Paracoccus caeni]
MSRTLRLVASAGLAVAMLASCGPNGNFDPDLRRWAPGGLNTSDAAARAAPRPAPDNRGVITFPNYQVAIAGRGDTPASIASRLGLNAQELAGHNALPADATLNAGQPLVLPRRIAGSAGTGGGGTGGVSDPFAGGGAAAQPTAPAATSAAGQPGQHVVAAGETAWSIARRYNVNVQDLASWNSLPSNMTLRVGQRLMIPVAGQAAPAGNTTTAPGSGSPTPRPPSAAQPLPNETPRAAADPGPEAPATDLGATRTAASGSGQFRMPVAGSIIRVYEKGRNDGIDIAATSGTAVNAAGGGTVAAVTKDTAGTPIVVVRHDGNLMTVYTGMDGLNVNKGDQVSAGQQIGKAGNGGFVHFEVRQGFDSVDPERYLQ